MRFAACPSALARSRRLTCCFWACYLVYTRFCRPTSRNRGGKTDMTVKRVVLIVVLVAAAAFLAAGLLRDEAPTSRRSGTGLRVVVLAVDGLDWFLLARYAEEGRLPAIARLMSSGVTGELRPEIPALPEVSWPAMAAGTPGVSTDVPGRAERRYGVVPRVAELVSASGGKALSVGWPASWPAAERDWPLVAGFAPRADEHVNELAPAVMPDGAGHASGAAFEDMVRAIASDAEEHAGEGFRRIINLDEADTQGWEDHLAAARWSHLADVTMLDIGARLLATEEPDLALVHIGGLDAVSHRFLAPAAPDFFSELPDEALRFGEVLPGYYEFIDRAVTRFIRLTDEETVFILCSAYGFRPSLETPRISGAHSDGPPGVFIVRGPRISPLPEPVTVSARDLAPTVLAILGVEIPDDIEGRVAIEVLPAGLRTEHPPVFGPAPPPDVGTVEEPDELAAARSAAAERLKSLREELQ
ncbi:MAG: hypothetical protein GF405_07040 [Candidatus Eisenbacteria bacterium]|nr:hypothetical protein [Candidatus Eisenbacteria bacterium]